MSDTAMFVPMDALLKGLRESPALRDAMRLGFDLEPDATALDDELVLQKLLCDKQSIATSARLVNIGNTVLRRVEERLRKRTSAADLRDLAVAASFAVPICLTGARLADGEGRPVGAAGELRRAPARGKR